MLGIAILAIFALLVGFIYFWTRMAWLITKSKMITGIVGFSVFMCVWWPLFGDYYPTVVAHKKYCESEAGFKIYVTAEQWAAENPGVLETLVPYENSIKVPQGYLFNERFIRRLEKTGTEKAGVKRLELSIVDVKTDKLLARDIDFQRGYGRFGVAQDARANKFWLYLDSCYSEAEIMERAQAMALFSRQIHTLGN